MATKLIALDTETTGFSPEFDRVIEIGCVDITNGLKEKTTFQCYINPQRNVSAGSTEIHGLTLEFLEQFQPFAFYAQNLLDFIEDSTLIIHNAHFDMSFLNAELKRNNFPELQNPVIDTVQIAKQMFPGRKVNLSALNQYFKVNIRRDLHGALLDAEILANIYMQMQVRQISLTLGSNSEQIQANPCDILVAINEDEIQMHEQILRRIQQ
jgi:DNA polymerase-3 subunit epsilon